MSRHNAIEETIDRARSYGREAQAALAIFPAGEACAALHGAVTFSVSRAH